MLIQIAKQHVINSLHVYRKLKNLIYFEKIVFVNSICSIKMELFETSKANLAKTLFFPNRTHVFNIERLLSILVALLLLLSVVSFFVFETNGVIEYVRSAYLSIGALAAFISFLSLVFKTKEIFLLIDTNFAETIRKSKLLQINTFSHNL